MSYTILNGNSDELSTFISQVNNKIQDGYTPLGSPGIETSGHRVTLYQAFIKSPLSATTTSSSASEPEIKKVESYTNTTLTVDGKKYHLDPTKMVYNEKKKTIGNFRFAYTNYPEKFDESKPDFYVKIDDFTEINKGGSKSTSRKSYKKYTKKSSSRRHKNRK